MKRLFKNVQAELEYIEKEIERIKLSLFKAHNFRGQGEYQASLWMLRNALEEICKSLYRNEISTEIGSMELRHFIKAIDENKIIPPHILPHIRTVQTFGNFGSHNNEVENIILDDNHILPAITSIEIIYKWFTEDYHGIKSHHTKQQQLSSELNFHRFFEEDMRASKHSLPIENYISEETILIVLGAHTCYELLDRPIANILRKKIDELGDHKTKRRAVIMTDIWYQRDSMLHGKTIISYGNRNENWATDKLLSISPGKVNIAVSTDECKVIEINKNIVFNANYPGGGLEATKNFIKVDEGLKYFLMKVWQI